MKILLYGKPGVGKSTILAEVQKNFEGKHIGILSREIRGKDGNRVGFEAINSHGEHRLFAHIDQIKSEYVIGDKYHVDLPAIDDFVVREIKQGFDHPDRLLFIDEIGRMQAFSELYLKTVDQLLNSDLDILATIVYEPEPWSIKFRENEEILLILVTEANRELLPALLITIYENTSNFHKLRKEIQNSVILLARNYFATDKLTQVHKLFKNAISYLVLDKVKTSERGYVVVGNHREHQVVPKNGDYTCDCDLFNGKGEYAGRAGECSHIQAVKLVSAPPRVLLTS